MNRIEYNFAAKMNKLPSETFCKLNTILCKFAWGFNILIVNITQQVI